MDHAGHGTGGVVATALMGLLTAVVAPALVVLLRRRSASRPEARMRARTAVAVAVGFTVLHAIVMLVGVLVALPGPVHVALHAVLLAGAVVFWWPVLGSTRLGAGGRALYLLAAAPCLDLAAMAVVVAGHEPAGLAMIISMLPLAAAAVGAVWRHLLEEERAADPLALEGGAR